MDFRKKDERMELKDFLQKKAKEAVLAGIGAVSMASEALNKFSKQLIKQGSEAISQDRIFSTELEHDLEDLLGINKPEPRNVTDTEIELFVEKLTPEQKAVVIEKIQQQEPEQK